MGHRTKPADDEQEEIPPRKPKLVVSLLVSLLGLTIAGPTGAQTVVTTVPVGHQPAGIAANPSTNRVYVANPASDTLSVLDAATNSVVTTIVVGDGPVGVAVNPALNRIYVSNALSDTISVVDGGSNFVVATIAVGTRPESIDVNPLTNRIYTTIAVDRKIAVLDGATNLLVGSIPFTGPGTVLDVAVSPSTNRVYAVSQNPDMLTVVDGATNAVLQAAPTDLSTSLAVNEATNRIYTGSNPLNVIDGSTLGLIATVPLSGIGATTVDSIAVNPATDRIYSSDFSAEVLEIVDGATNTRVATLALHRPHSVAVIPDLGRAYVTNTLDDTVSVIQDVAPINHPPRCGNAKATPRRLWPPNEKFRVVTVTGASDPDGDPVDVVVRDITQDERVRGPGAGITSPDAKLTSPPSRRALIRAERSGNGDGRVYRLRVVATDNHGATCTAKRRVGVPHDRHSNAADSAPPSYDSLLP